MIGTETNVKIDASAEAHLTWRNNGTAKIIVYGYARDIATGMMISGCTRHQRTVRDKTDLKQGQTYLINTIIAEYNSIVAKKARAAAARSNDKGIYTAAYESISRDELLPAYAESTRRSTITFFTRKILHRMDNYGYDLDTAAMRDIRQELIEGAVKNHRSDPNYSTASHSVDAYLQRINKHILQPLYEKNPDLPKYIFICSASRVTSSELAKYFTDEERILLSYVLRRLVSSGPAMGVACMFYLDLRTAESCGVRIGDITLEDVYATYPVLSQYHSGHMDDRLKTSAAYRPTIGPYFFCQLVAARIKYLGGLGYTSDEINEMPLAGSRTDPRRHLDPSELARYAKSLFRALGFSATLEAATELMIREPVNGSSDAGAYISRRDWITRTLNVCGLDIVDADVTVGHDIGSALRAKDYTNPDIQALIAKQLENYAYDNDPMYTLHPYWHPIVLSGRCHIELDGYGGYRLVADTALNVTLDITTSEPGQSIQLQSDGTLAGEIELKRGRKDTPELRIDRPIIGRTPILSAEEYDDIRRKADAIDLSAFL